MAYVLFDITVPTTPKVTWVYTPKSKKVALFDWCLVFHVLLFITAGALWGRLLVCVAGDASVVKWIAVWRSHSSIHDGRRTHGRQVIINKQSSPRMHQE